MPNTDPVVDSAPLLRSLRDAAARDARIPVGFMPAITRGLRRRASSPRWPSCATRARSASPTTAGRSPSAGDAAQGAAVPAPVRRRARAARGGPVALAARGAMHEGAVSAPLGVAGHPDVSRVDDGRPRRALAGYEDGAHPLPAPQLRASPSRRSPPPRPRGVRVTCEASPHHLLLTDEDVARPRHAHEDEPAAAHRGATARRSSTACATGRSTASPPTTRPHARDEKEVPFEQAPMGTTGLETAFAALHTELVLAGRPRRSTLLVERLTRRRRPVRPARCRGSRSGEPANLTLVDLERRVGRGRERLRVPLGELLLRRARRCRARCCSRSPPAPSPTASARSRSPPRK